MRALTGILLLGFLLSGCSREERPPVQLPLNDQWIWSHPKEPFSYDAQVPGTIQENLMGHYFLPDLLQENNAVEAHAMEGGSCMFERLILLSDLPERKRYTLRFDGLDTYAKVYLNDSLLLEANNMFRSWEVTLKREDLQPKNTLRVVFPSIVQEGSKAREALGYPLPSPNDAGTHPISPFVRKAPYQFGWDWGPRVVTQGIWKGVSLQAWDDWRLTGVRIRQFTVTEEAAYGHVIYTVENHREQSVHLLLAADGQPLVSTTARLNEGTQEMAVPFVLENPELWWPNGWGEARLYSMEASITARSGQTQSQRKKIGFRTLKLDRQPDSIGTRFTIRVNGHPLFAKGANCIPQSLFPGSVSPGSYQRLLTDAHRSHFNMLRVWGGGIYEHDRFYDLCDSLGILVWQDFMFAGAMYPSDSAFLANVQAEAMEQVARLSDHPSLTLWCGNNEVDVAWHNWGWQQQFGYSAEQQAEIKRGYDQLFKHILPNAVERLAPGTPYVHTSPLSNWGTAANFDHHNMHYWGVWHGPDNFDGFARYVPRFMTEYGFQSFPQAAAMAQQIPREHLSLTDSLLLSRQKSYKTNAELIRHLEQHYPVIADYDTFAYLSQLNQQLAMETAINAHRADRERCSGTLYWQLNDVWSGATWSTIDHTGAWKAAHYTVRDRYKPVVALPQLRGDSVFVSVANDLRQAVPLRLTMTGMTFSGDTLAFHEQELEVPANGSLKIYQWPVIRWLGGKARTEAFLRVELHGPDALVDATHLFFTEPKALALPPANATMQVNPEHGQVVVTITPKTFLKNAWLDAGVPGIWSANYLDLLPHQPARLTFTPAVPGADSLVIRMLTLNDLLNISGSDQ